MSSLIYIILYFVPSIVAFFKHKNNRKLILVINFFLGWTIVGWILSLFLALSDKKLHEIISDTQPSAEQSPYQIRFSVMNASEEAFFHEIQRQISKDFYVFPKVRVADILKTRDGRGYYYSRNKILPKHVDFLICDLHFRPIMAIELNGSSHKRQKTIESDELKRKVFDEVGFPLKVILVGESFLTAVQQIIASLPMNQS